MASSRKPSNVLRIAGAWPSTVAVAAAACFTFPEFRFFLFNSGPLPSCADPAVHPAHTLQAALRLCLALQGCLSLQWDSKHAVAVLCGAADFQHEGEACSDLRHSRVLSAFLKAPADSHGVAVISGSMAAADGSSTSSINADCPRGQATVNGTCDVCPGGWCRCAICILNGWVLVRCHWAARPFDGHYELISLRLLHAAGCCRELSCRRILSSGFRGRCSGSLKGCPTTAASIPLWLASAALST